MASTVPRTAKDILGLADVRGDYIQGNTDPEISATGRDQDTFKAQKDALPGGKPFPPFWDSSR
jgi:hypothetical protein